MITHLSLGTETFAANRKLKQLIDNQVVMLGGNKKLKIYGTLTCASGKRMKTENRVFLVLDRRLFSMVIVPVVIALTISLRNGKQISNCR